MAQMDSENSQFSLENLSEEQSREQELREKKEKAAFERVMREMNKKIDFIFSEKNGFHVLKVDVFSRINAIALDVEKILWTSCLQYSVDPSFEHTRAGDMSGDGERQPLLSESDLFESEKTYIISWLFSRLPLEDCLKHFSHLVNGTKETRIFVKTVFESGEKIKEIQYSVSLTPVFQDGDFFIQGIDSKIRSKVLFDASLEQDPDENRSGEDILKELGLKEGGNYPEIGGYPPTLQKGSGAVVLQLLS